MRKQFSLFLFSSECLWKTNVWWWKNCKIQVFHVFYQFLVTQKLLPGYHILGAKTDFWAYICRVKNPEKTKSFKNLLFQFRVERCRKNHVFSRFCHVFFYFWSRQMFRLLRPSMVTPAHVFPYALSEDFKDLSSWNHISTE